MQKEHWQILVKHFRTPFYTFPHLLYYHVTQFTLCINFKSSCTFLTALTRLSDILAVQQETKNRQCRKFLQMVPLF